MHLKSLIFDLIMGTSMILIFVKYINMKYHYIFFSNFDLFIDLFIFKPFFHVLYVQLSFSHNFGIKVPFFNFQNNMKIWGKKIIFIKKSKQHKHMKIHCS